LKSALYLPKNGQHNFKCTQNEVTKQPIKTKKIKTHIVDGAFKASAQKKPENLKHINNILSIHK
jgi:hypothetical protein